MLKKLIPSIVTILVAVGIFLYGQRVVDIVLAETFTPAPAVSAINQRLQLTSEGARLVLASKTEIKDAQAFNESCQSRERTAAILGCYYMKKIHLFDISNPELDGATEVTAAHEMLHAGYDRLTFFERHHVDELIKNEYEKVKNDPMIAKDMEYYKMAEPGEEINELHSIIGTTVATVTPELEKYYSRYFEDRATVVALNEAYNTVFVELSKRAEQLQLEITAEEAKLKQDLVQYEIDKKQVDANIQAFNDRASNSEFSSQSSFNVARSALTRTVAELNQRRAAINSSVESFNAKIAELNALSVKVDEINKSMNGVSASSGV